MKQKLFFITILSIVGLTITTNAFASGNLTVRLGQPKTPTNQNNLKLTFVALEIGGSSEITVDCYKKLSTDSDYTKFDTKTLIAGGNTDYCTANSSVLNTAGEYSFYVKANGVQSNTVTVNYNSTFPSTPVSYSKERLNDCDYKIKFKTADDGRTVKVELFRSDTKSISLDSGGRVASMNIGPNTEGEFINSVPTCGKEYFYAIRAVDNSDNVSGTTGDSNTTTTSSTTTTTQNGGSAIAIGSGSQVSGGTITDETIAQTPSEAPSSTESGEASVLGAETSKGFNLKWLSIPLILIAAYFFLKSRKRA